jgi:hypothetical protein
VKGSGVARFSESTVVATSIDRTFDYVTDQDKVAEWNEHVQSVEVVEVFRSGSGRGCSTSTARQP